MQRLEALSSGSSGIAAKARALWCVGRVECLRSPSFVFVASISHRRMWNRQLRMRKTCAGTCVWLWASRFAFAMSAHDRPLYLQDAERG